MRARITAMILSGAILCTFTSCHVSPNMVHLKSVAECEAYGLENYPACTAVSKEKNRHEHKCVFTDEKCGFTFTVSSSVGECHLDGCVCGYEEKFYSDWDDQYYQYIVSRTEDEISDICSENGCEIKWEIRITPAVAADMISDRPADEVIPVLDEIGHIIDAADVYDYFSEGRIDCCGTDHMRTAIYYFDRGEAVDAETDKAETVMENAEKQLGVKCRCTRIEKIPMRDIPGSGRNTSDLCTVWFFTAEDGREMFAADIKDPSFDYYIEEAVFLE